MRYEHVTQPILSPQKWRQRLRRSISYAVSLMAISLGVGVAGYHFIGDLPIIDALLESAMILGGMGPIAPMHNDAVKLFASFYALFSGFVMLSSSGIILAPVLHRLLHHFHADCPDRQ